MRNIKSKITILKKHKNKVANKNNNTNLSNNDDIIDNNCNNNNSINSNNSENECLICLEVNNNNEKTIKLNDLSSCEKLCECNGWFHKSCLDNWFIIKFTCPICRNSIDSFNPQHQIHQINNFNNTQTYIQIIETRLTNNDFFIIFFSALFIYCFYFK